MAMCSMRRSAAPRIQIFVSDLSATGVVRNAVAIANEAAASGYEVRLLTCNPDGVLRSQIRSDVLLVKLASGASLRRPRRVQLLHSLFNYHRHSREWRPDIMLSAGNHGHLLSSIAWLGLPGRKVLRISNDLQHGSPSLPTRWWRGLKFRLIAALADRLVLVSRAHAQHPLLARHLASSKAVIIGNGVDIEAVRAASRRPCAHPWAEDGSVPLVLAVGRHVRQKNLATLVRAFASARRRKPMRLIILGDGSKAETGKLQDLAASLGVSDAVDLAATTSNPFPLMAAAQTLALPSLWEGSSNVLLEAMACGTPVIASRTAGDAEHVLGHGRYGILIEPHDIESLALALIRQTSANRVEGGARVSSFGRHLVLTRYIRLFDQLVAGERLIGVADVRRPKRGGVAARLSAHRL